MKNHDIQTPLGKVEGLGSAKEGTGHWWWQRFTAVALIPLFIWFFVSVLCLLKGDYYEVATWIESPFVSTMLITFLLFICFHATLGLQVVIEDYIHKSCCKISLLIFIKGFYILSFLFGTFVILKIAFGG